MPFSLSSTSLHCSRAGTLCFSLTVFPGPCLEPTAEGQCTLFNDSWHTHVPRSTVSSLRAGMPLLNFLCLMAPSRRSHAQGESGADLTLDYYLCRLSKSKTLRFYMQYVYGGCTWIHTDFIVFPLLSYLGCRESQKNQNPGRQTVLLVSCGHCADVAITGSCHPCEFGFVLFCFVSWNLPQILILLGIRQSISWKQLTREFPAGYFSVFW